MILGGGPNRIGQGIEFDYCCVHAAKALKKLGFETIIVNCNPETVSTDYDTSDKLYFEPLTAEDVLAIYAKEKPLGVIAQFGGQTPLNLARPSSRRAGVRILGTSPEIIDLAEDRDRFRAVMEALGIPMPEAGMAVDRRGGARQVAQSIGYPGDGAPQLRAGRPRHGGRLRRREPAAATWPPRWASRPTAPSSSTASCATRWSARPTRSATACMRSCPRSWSTWSWPASTRATRPAILPSVNISDAQLATIKEYTRRIAEAMHVCGLMNIQYAIEGGTVYVLEANPRASRTVPLVSKVCGIQMVQIATEVMTACPSRARPSPVADLHGGVVLQPLRREGGRASRSTCSPEVDPVLGPEMRSTGEVLGLADDLRRARSSRRRRRRRAVAAAWAARCS